ncbi:MAG: lysophospholipid acyltransferase family protein [Planctomycetota bacterium]
MKRGVLERIALAAIAGGATAVFGLTIRYLRHSCRWHLGGPLHAALAEGKPLIVASWHQDALLFFHYLANYTRIEARRPFVMLASRSFDGEVTERIMRPWGFRLVRGSFGRAGGHAAARGLLRALAAGERVAVVADGPRPPAAVMRRGAVFLARESGAPLYVARAWARPQVLVPRTWFRLAVPLPRAHLACLSAGPIDVSGTLEEARTRAEGELRRLCEEADALLYLRRRMAGGVRLAARPV